MADVTVSIGADISQFEQQMNEITNKYQQTKSKIEEKRIDTTPLSSQETGNETRKSYGYMFKSFDELRDTIGDVSSIGTDLPGEMIQAVSSLSSGMKAALSSLKDSLKTAGKAIQDSFDPNSFNNGIRYQATSLKQYAHDLKEASIIASKMTNATRNALGSNTTQLLSLVSPAIAQISAKERKTLSDVALRGRMQSDNYGYISKFLNSIGITDRTQQQHALDFAIKTSSSRIHRADVAEAYNYARMRGNQLNVAVTDQFRESYKTPFLHGGRFVSDSVTPLSNARTSREATRAYYNAIQQEILHGNNVAFKAAVEAGLVSLDRGQFSFAKEGSVLKNKDMLNHFSGLIVREAKRASQGSPQYFKSVTNPYEEEALLDKDNIALREARRLIAYDARPDARPYLVQNYQKPKASYQPEIYNTPELKIGESINIPRMSVKNINGKPQFIVQTKDGDRSNIDFNWKKSGVVESVNDEFITMGRNPILDRLMKLHPETKFENRGFGYGFDANDKAKTGKPLIIDMPLEAFYNKDSFGKILFRDEETGRTAHFQGDSQTLIRKLYSGELTPALQFQGEKEPTYYRAFAGKLENGGSIKFMQNKDYEKLRQDDIDRGVIPMLDYFSEVDKNGKLINPATGQAFEERSKDAYKAYARFFDARNKILSHSIPIEDLGGQTPLAALVNFEAFYDAAGISKNGGRRFDGGAFISPEVFNTDFQARMGPAKFLAQRFNWRDWFEDSGLTYVDAQDKHHMFMPGMSATASDYIKFKADQKRYLSGQMNQSEMADFEKWRDERFVDVMDEKYGILMADSALKSTNKLGFITPAKYDEISKIRANAGVSDTSFTQANKRALTGGGMVPLTPAQQTELMAMMSDRDNGIGLRMMKDTENYYGEKDFWAPAFMSSVQMSPAMMMRSVENYRKAFQELSTPEGIIKRMFSGSDMDSYRVQADPRLIYTDKDIRARVERQISDLESKQIEGYGYFPGMAQMMLAGVNPSAPLGDYAKDLMDKEIGGDAALLIAKAHGIIAPMVSNKGLTNWTRSPYAPGANFFAKSISSKVASKYGLSDNIALFNPEDFYELNTGDFDGDFVWAYQALKDDEDFKRMTEERNRAVNEFMKKRQEDAARRKDLSPTEQAVEYQHDASDFAQAVLRTTNTINPIGIGYKLGQAGRVMKLTPEELQVIDDYANDVYGAAIDQKKDPGKQIREATGVLKDAVYARQPFDRLVGAIMEEAGKNEFGGTDIFKYALPTYLDPMGVSVLSGALAGRNSKASYGSSYAAALRQNVEARYQNKTDEERDLAKWYQDILIGKLTGEYQITTQDQLQEGYKKVAAVENRAKALKAQDVNSQEAADMEAMASRARRAIRTEEVMGFTEGQLGNIERYYGFNRWRNPVQDGFRNQASGRAAILFQEEARRAQEEAIFAQQQQAVESVASSLSGRNLTGTDRDNIYERILTANRYTGFNFSNAKYWTEGNKVLTGAKYSNLDETNAKDAKEIVSAFQEEALKYNSKASVARQILTGIQETNVDAIVGSAAHAFMDTYGAYRSMNGGTRDQAKEAAIAAFENVLFGDEYAKDRETAGVSFERGTFSGSNRPNGSYLAKMANGSRPSQLVESKLKNVINTLNGVAQEYYDRTLEHSGTDHMIMTEGTMFDDNGNQIKSRRTEGGNGIWIEPMRDGQRVLPFTRYRKGADGRLEETNAGLYFTPDIIKKNDKGEITIADWKSSEHGQKDALFQTAFYAHQLEELGKRYWTSGTSAETRDKDLEWFGQFVNQEKDGSFTSNIKWLQAINMFGKKGEKLLTQNYTMQMGDDISKWMENGMVALAASASTGFFEEHPEFIVPILSRSMRKGRSTLAPGQKEEDFAVLNEETKAAINAEMDRINNIYKGGTGVKDSEGHFIDQDKSYLVAKFMKEQEELADIRSFANKQNRLLFNKGLYTQDDYTQRIDQLKNKFSSDEYATIQKYLEPETGIAPDLALLEKDFDANQVEAVRTMKELMDLRDEYVKQLPQTMKTEYDAIKFSGKDMASQLTIANYKRKRDMSALQGSYERNPYYDYDRKAFKLTEDQYYIHPGEKKEDETEESYQERINKAQEDARIKVAAAKEEMAKYSTQERQIEAAYEDFSGNWIERLSKAKETEGNILLSAFSAGSIDKAAFTLEQEAKKYEQLATKGSGEGEHRVYEYSSAERLALMAEQERKEQQAELIKSIKGTSLEGLLSYQQDYQKEQVDALLHGRSVSAEARRNKALGDAALQYLSVHGNATPQELISAINGYGSIYDSRSEETQEKLISNLQFSNEMAQRQRDHQYQQMERGRIASRGRISQYYTQQQDRAYELRNQRDTAEFKAEQIQRDITNGKYNGDTAGLKAAQEQLKGYQKAAADANDELQKFGPVQNAVAAGAHALSDSLNMVMRRFGRQLFSKALQEAKKFVQEFNQQMTTIQMITLKSNEEMSKLGDGLIDKAKELKISISEISSSAATLYRQGLSDEEVNNRLEVISKFSKVSGAKVDEATKLITVAMNTGLVTDPQQAADIVTALGDAAATNAQQIEKGIEKAGAAAAADGTTFAELASMLTAITATTQIGGNVAGRTLNTIFGRMNKIGTNELIYDENGHAVSGSAVAQLLKSVGINQYDENGNKRSSFETLYALSQKWDSLSDAEQQQFANAIAGTRQYSNFSAIMQGMAEGKVDEYMKLAGESTGILDKKYGIYAESLQASLTDLKNTFDALIADLVDKGYVQDFVEGLTTMINGVDNLVTALGGLKTALPVVMTLVGILAGAKFGGIGAIIGGFAGLGTYGALTALGTENKAKDRNIEYQKTYENNISEYQGINRLKELRSTQSRTTEENEEYANLINKYAVSLGLTSSTSDDATYSIESLTNALGKLSSAADEAADKVIKEATEQEKQEFADLVTNTRGDVVRELLDTKAETAGELNQNPSLGNGNFNNYLWTYDAEQEKYILDKNALFKQQDLVQRTAQSDTIGGRLYQLIFGKKRSYQDDIEHSLVSMYLDAATAGRMGEEKKFWTYDDWNNRIKSGQVTQEELEAAFEYMNPSKRVDSNTFKARESASKGVLSRLLSGKYSDEQIDYLAHKMALDWQTGNVADAYNNIVGTSNKYEDIIASVDKSLEGYVEKSKSSLEKLGLEDTGESGYYLDENGQRVSQAEAKKRVEEYNKLKEQQAHTYKVVGNNEDIGNVFGTYGGDYTLAEAKELAENTHPWYVQDPSGERRYFATKEEAEQAKEDYRKGSFRFGAKVYSASGTKEEVEKQLEEERQRLASKAFTVRYKNGGYTGKTFGSEEEALAYAEELNKAERARVRSEEERAEYEQRKNSSASYTNLYGETIQEKGISAIAKLTQQRQQELEETPFVLQDLKGNTIDTYKTIEDAKEALIDYTNYFNARTGEYLGKGQEGLNAVTAAKLSLDYFANGEYIGSNAEGRAEAERLERYKHQVKGTDGKIFKFEELSEAEDFANREEDNLRTRMIFRYNDLLKTYGPAHKGNMGPVDILGRYSVLWKQVEEEFSKELENLGDAAVLPFKAEITTKQTPVDIATSVEARIKDAKDVIGELYTEIPELAKIDPAQIAEVYGRLPTSIQMLIDETIKTGEASVEVIETINEALVQVKKPDLKAIYNRFNGGSTVSYNAWATDNKTSLALLADEAIRTIQDSGALSIENRNIALQTLVDSINWKDNKQWESLVQQSPEFGRIVNQIKLDAAGRVVSAPQDALEQLTTWLYKNGRDYGELPTTLSERAIQAQRAFTGLTTQGWYTSYEARNDALEDEYQKNIVEPFEAKWQLRLNTEEERQAEREGLITDTRKAYRQARKDMTTLDQYAEGKFGDVHYLSDLDQTYLSEILGADIATRVKNNTATAQELALSSTLLSNAQYGISGLTARNKLSGIRDVRQAIASGMIIGDQEGQYRSTVASQYFQGWGGFNDYVALTKALAEGDMDKFKELGGQEYLDTLNASLDEFEKASQLKIDIEGVQQLEEAGKVASGTADAIEKLRKGGKIALDVIINAQNKAYSAGQTSAKLANGTIAQQDEAIMSILGIDREQLYTNRNYYAGLAAQQDRLSREEQIASLYEEYKYATSKQKTELRKAARGLGYTLGISGYKDIGLPEIDRTSYFSGKEQQYTDAELTAARLSMLNGEEISQELEDAASGGYGYYGQEYMRQLQAVKDGITGAKEPSDQLKRMAIREAEIANKKAQEAQALTEAEFNTQTFGGVSAYSNILYKQQNKASLAANELYQSLSGANIQSAQDMVDLLGDKSNVDNWKDLLEATPELTEEFKRMGHSVSEDGTIDWSAIETQEGNLDNALADLVSIIAKHSKDFADAEYQTRSDVFESASKYNPADHENTSEYYDEYAQVVGEDIAARERATDYNLNGFEQWYRDTRYENYGNGIDGLTELNKLQGAQWILNSIRDKTYDVNTSQDVLSDVTGSVEGLDKLIQAYLSGTLAAEDFEKMQKDVSAALSAAEYASLNYGDSVDAVSESLQKLAKGGKTARQELTRIREASYDTQDKMTAWEEAYNDGKVKSGKQISKEGREAISKQTGVAADTIKKWTEEEMAANFANEGTKSDINQEMNEYVTALINDALADIRSVIGNDVKLNEKIDIGGTVDIICNPDGSINMDGLIALAKAAESDAIGVLEALAQGKLAEWVATLKTQDNGDGTFAAWIDANTTTFGKSGAGGSKYNNRGGGGGGGGSEKSELDKALERIKHQVSEVEHQSKLLEIAYEGLNYVNDFGGMNSNIDAQIESQERLAGVYSSSIAELEAQKASLEQGSEEWYKAADAIMQYEEALAGVNNTINKLHSLRIEIIEEKQQYQTAPKTYTGSMLEKHAQRYQITGQFEAYESITKSEIENYKDEIALNQNQIKEWEDLLRDTIKNSDDAEKIKQKIWDKKVETEQLQNDVLSAQLELSKARVDQIAKDMENSVLAQQHANDVLGTYAGIYESTNQYGKYQDALQKQATNLAEIKAANEKALEDLRMEVENLAEDDPAREYAIQALYERENTLAELDAEMLNNRQSLEESYITEIGKNHEQREKAYTHEGKLLDEMLKKYQNDDDYINQQNILSEMTRNTGDQIVEARTKLEDYIDLQNSGKISEGSPQWYNLQDAINETTEAIASLENEYTSTYREMQQLSFDNILKTFKEGNEEIVGTEQLQHERNLISYEQTKYQNRGELTNVGLMIQADREVIDKQVEETKKEIEALEQFKETATDNPELYKRATEEIRKQEEALAKLTVEQEKNTKSLEKNQEAIRQARMKVENETDKAIRSLVQKEKSMLAATVSLQNHILDTIRNNYREQWDLEKKTIEKKKQALNEEKNLLTERLNFRKKMMDQESKDEELAEYKRQLALISADTTRTKDANELRRKIAEMEKEQALQDAQDVANAEIKTIDDRSKAWDNYVAVQEEDLNNLLSNANNFRETLDKLLTGTFKDFVDWNMEYNKSYANATEEQRKQMEEGWDDTWYNMLGWLRTYWDDVDEDIRSKDGFLALLTSTDDYNKLSDTGKESYLYNMGELYDNFVASTVKDAKFGDQHEILTTLQDLKDWTFKVQIADPEEYMTNVALSSYLYNRNRNPAGDVDLELYEGWGKERVTYSGGGSGGGSGDSGGTGGNGGNGKQTIYYATGSGAINSVYGTWDDVPRNAMHASTSLAQVQNYVKGTAPTIPASEMSEALKQQKINEVKNSSIWGTKTTTTPTETVTTTTTIKKTRKNIPENAEGGLVDYTGLAWVDGTKTKPESFLDATDTKLLRNMLDAFTYVKTAPYMTHINDNNFGNKNVSVGDINVNLYEAKLEKDADYDAVAQKVGKAFTKQLEKGGFNLAQYNW